MEYLSRIVANRKQLLAVIVAAGLLAAIFVPFQMAEAFVVTVNVPSSFAKTPTGEAFSVDLDISPGEFINADSISLVIDDNTAFEEQFVFDSSGSLISGDSSIISSLNITIVGGSSGYGYGYGYGLVSDGSAGSGSSVSTGFIGNNSAGSVSGNGTSIFGGGIIGPATITFSGIINSVNLDDGSHTIQASVLTDSATTNQNLLSSEQNFSVTLNPVSILVSSEQLDGTPITGVDMGITDANSSPDPVVTGSEIGQLTPITFEESDGDDLVAGVEYILYPGDVPSFAFSHWENGTGSILTPDPTGVTFANSTGIDFIAGVGLEFVAVYSATAIPPVANAGADFAIFEGLTGSLNGTASTDSDGSIVSFSWLQTGGTVAVTLDDPTSPTPSFTAPQVPSNTAVQFTLTVTDNDNATDTDNVVIGILNTDSLISGGAVIDNDASGTSSVGDAVHPGVTINLTGPVNRTTTTSGTGAYSFPALPPGVYNVTEVVPSGFHLIAPASGVHTVVITTTSQTVTGQNFFNAPNDSPVADAGSNQTVSEGDPVTLNGTGSTDDFGIASFFWNQTSGPAVTLDDSSSQTPSFTAPSVTADTDLTFELTVTDEDGASDIDSVTITVQNVNGLPVADAGADQTVNEGDLVTLNGSASADSDGTIVSFSWNQTSGIAVTLSDASAVSPTFTAPSVTSNEILTFELTVVDNDGANDTDATTVTVQEVNSPPTADAGADQTVFEGLGVTLNGTGSTDSDGTIVSFFWNQTSGPAVTLDDSSSQTPSFTAPSVTAGGATLTFELTVTDNNGANDTDSVNVLVQNTNSFISGGAVIDNDASGANSVGDAVHPGVTINLTGPVNRTTTTSGTGAYSFQALPPGVYNVTEVLPLGFHLVSPADGVHTVNITSTSQSATGNTFFNAPNDSPVADAGANQTVTEGDLVTLNGTGSTDDFGIASFFWNQTSGIAVTLSDSSAVSPTFTAPSVTTDEALTFELTVTDEDGASDIDSVTITVQNVNQLPTADAGANQTVNEGDLVTLNGTGSTDSDGTIASFLWIQTAGTSVTLSDDTSATPSFTAPSVPADETLTFELTVTDNNGANDTDTVNVLVVNVNQPPVADAGADQTVFEGQLVTLDGSASADLDGSIEAFAWTQTSGPAVTLSNSTIESPTFTAPSVVASTTLTFELTVTDNEGANDTDSVDITVTPIGAFSVAYDFANETLAKSPGVTIEMNITVPAGAVLDSTVPIPLTLAPGLPNPADQQGEIHLWNNSFTAAPGTGTPESLLKDITVSPAPSTIGSVSGWEGPVNVTISATLKTSFLHQGPPSTNQTQTLTLEVDGTSFPVTFAVGGSSTVETRSNILPGENTITTGNNMTITINPTGGNGTVTVAEETVSNLPGVFDIDPDTNTGKVSVGTATLQTVGDPLEIDAEGLEFPVDITIHYNETLLPPEFDESDIRFLHFNETSNEWEDVTLEAPNNPNTGLDTITGRLFSLSPVVAGFDTDDDDGAPSGGGGGGGGGGRGGGGGSRGPVVVSWPATQTQPESYFFEFPLQRIQVASSAFLNAAGISIAEGRINQQISISGEFTNYQDVLQDYAFIVQVTDENGFTTDISWQESIIGSGSTSEISVLWTPETDGVYTVKIFVWDGISSTPTPLSDVTVKNLRVTE